MQIYIVGGAVRDTLLGKNPKDIDYCVVGTTVDTMKCLGFKPIQASSFPVFHDDYGNEYALARTETKHGNGYHGFETNHNPTITIEEDLKRRDITINSMAVKIEDWTEFKITKSLKLVIDPYGGIDDLKDGIIRHTSEAFKDDPVRVLRALRLAVRYDFDIDTRTLTFIGDMLSNGDLNYLTPERIWLEIHKVFLDNKNILKFFDLLFDTNVFYEIIPFEMNDIKISYEHIDSLIVKHKTPLWQFISLFVESDYKHIENLVKFLKMPMVYSEFMERVKLIIEVIESDNDLEKMLKMFKKTKVFDPVKRVAFDEALTFVGMSLGLDIEKIEKNLELSSSINIEDVNNFLQCDKPTGKLIGETLWNLRKKSMCL